MVSEGAQTTEDAQPVEMPRIEDKERGDPRAYARVSGKLTNLVLSKKINRNDWKAMSEALAQACKASTGISLEDALMKGRDVIGTFIGIMEHSAEELLKVKAEVGALEDHRATRTLKKKWASLIDEAIALQEKARLDPMIFMVYVGRDDDPKRAGQVFEMSDHHHDYFETWNDPDFPNSLIEAPPGHAKSTCLRYNQAWEIGDEPTLRCLYLTDEKGKASDTVMSLKAILRSERYRAVFPDIRILGRMDQAKDDSRQFTVGRANEFAKDATVYVAGILTRIQGRRFDRIYADDVCTEDVRDHKTTRDNTNSKFFGVVLSRWADPAHTKIRVIGTPWHVDDVLAKLEKAVAQKKLKGWRVMIDRFRIKDDENGNPVPIWKKFRVEDFQQQKVLDGKNYDLNYRLRPSSESSQAVTRICWYNSKPVPPLTTDNDLQLLDGLSRAELWLSIDPAGTDKKYSSDTGACEIALTPSGYAFLRRTWSWHVPMDEILKNIVEVVMNAPPPGYYGIQWEAQGAIKGGMPVIIKELRRLLLEAGCMKVPLIVTTGTMVGGYSQNRSKLMRLQSCASILFHGAVRFPGERYRRPYRKGKRPPGQSETFVGPTTGTRMEQLANSILQFDGTMDTDCIDSITQWILNNAYRLKSPFTPVVQKAPVDQVDGFTACFQKQIEENNRPKPKSDRHQEALVFQVA